MDLEIRTGLSEKAGRHNTLATGVMGPGEEMLEVRSAELLQCRETFARENSDCVDYLHSEK